MRHTQKRNEEEAGKRSKQCGQLEKSLKQLADELCKANEIIKRLQDEVKQHHAKVPLSTFN